MLDWVFDMKADGYGCDPCNRTICTCQFICNDCDHRC